MNERPPERLVQRVAEMLGRPVISWRRVEAGYTNAGRWLVRCDDGRTAFVKAGLTADTARWLRDEWRIYGHVRGRFLANVLGWQDDEIPVLLLEDLSRADWPPPWALDRVESVLAALDSVAAAPAPLGLPQLADIRTALAGWHIVAGDSAPFLSLGLCSRAWLESALPALMQAEDLAPLEGESLVHLDVRSDNICFVGDRVVLVDWNWACIGNPRMDVAAWLPSLAAEGGPAPQQVLPHEPGLAALIAGYFASHAGLPEPSPGMLVRALQLRHLRIALPWAANALGLSPPDGQARVPQ